MAFPATSKLSPVEAQALSGRKINYQKFISRKFLITDKEGMVVPFIPNPPQVRLLEEMTNRNIILKARQMGFSYLILAIMTADFLTKPNCRNVVISHETEATKKLLERAKFLISSFEELHGVKLPLSTNNQREIKNTQTGGTFYIGTAGAKAFGRGDTIHNLHVSELAFYENPETVMTGLLEAVPMTGRIFVESTANGTGNYFHNMWKRAAAMESDFTPFFFSFREMPEYQGPGWIEQKKRSMDDPRLFDQEYPDSAEVAFLTSGVQFFDRYVLREMIAAAKDPIQTGMMDMGGNFI